MTETTMYGLPEEVVYCRRCVMSNQRPSSSVEFRHTPDRKVASLHIDEDGICDACRFAEVKDQIDWKDRESQLVELLDQYRRDDGRYDCIVPGSGGKDSCYAAYMLKYRYGMHPLTVTWPPIMYTVIGLENFRSDRLAVRFFCAFDRRLFVSKRVAIEHEPVALQHDPCGDGDVVGLRGIGDRHVQRAADGVERAVGGEDAAELRLLLLLPLVVAPVEVLALLGGVSAAAHDGFLFFPRRRRRADRRSSAPSPAARRARGRRWRR